MIEILNILMCVGLVILAFVGIGLLTMAIVILIEKAKDKKGDL